MKYTIYEDPVALKFALLRLPDKFIDGDRLPILPTDRWFDSREEAVAALPNCSIGRNEHLTLDWMKAAWSRWRTIRLRRRACPRDGDGEWS